MKSRMLVSMLVIALAAAVIGGATMAWFTDAAATDEVTFQAGTLMIDVDELGDAEVANDTDFATLDRLNPGDCWQWEFYVRNVGTKGANWLLYMCYLDTIGRDNNGLGDGQQELLAARDDYGTKGLSEVLEWTITVDDEEVYSGGLDGAPFVLDELDAFAFGVPGEEVDSSKKVVVTACLPKEAGNEYQGASMDIAFGVRAWQTTNGATHEGSFEEGIECPFGEVGDTYTVIFMNDDVQYDEVDGIESGDAALPFPDAPTKAGFNFVGWFTAPDGEGEQFTSSTAVTNNITVYAYWTEVPAPPKFTVTLEGPCSVKLTGAGEYAAGASVTVSADKSYKSRNKTYNFSNWTVIGQGVSASNDRSYTFTMPSNNVTLKANYKQQNSGGPGGH